MSKGESKKEINRAYSQSVRQERLEEVCDTSKNYIHIRRSRNKGVGMDKAEV
jgi:hypothetical protein